MTSPFFYILRHKDTGIKYAGIKFAKGCHPSDLLTKYFTSSKVVSKMLSEDINSFVIEKIIEFDNKDNLIEFEEFFLTEVNAAYSNKWFNQAMGKAINPDAVSKTCMEKYGVSNWMQSDDAKEMKLGYKVGNTYGAFTRSDETKRKMSEAFTGRVYSDEHNRKISESRKGTSASEETKKKMSDIKKGIPRPKSFSDKMSIIMKGENNPMFGKPSPNRGKTPEKFLCSHCGQYISKANFTRWHGEKCKQNNHLAIA